MKETLFLKRLTESLKEFSCIEQPKTLSLRKISTTKQGSCPDITHFIAAKCFDKKISVFPVLFLAMNKKGKKVETHTFPVLKIDGFYYIFESMWKSEIYRSQYFENLDDAIFYWFEEWVDALAEKYGIENQVSILKYPAWKKSFEGLNEESFVKKVLENSFCIYDENNLKEKLKEETIEDFDISGITQKSINKNGVKDPLLISANVIEEANKKDLELLFEVESSEDEAHKVDLKGNPKESKRGYAVVVRFKDIQDTEDIDKIIEDCDVVVHCDCPAFYFQGMQQDDSINGNARYKFQGEGGNHSWTLRHAHAGGKTGKALCKHLESVKKWLEDKSNHKEIQNKIN